MLRNYIKIAWRNLLRYKAYASINVLGLSLGIACSILIFTLVNYHLSFDTFHPNKERIYRVVTEWHEDDVDYSPGVPQPLGKAFRNDYTFAEKTARVVSYRSPLISLPNEGEIKKFRETSGISFVEPAFFDIFNFPLLTGNKQTALSAPNSAIITEQKARKYFGKASAIGKTIRINNKIDFVITGILKDLPPNTDIAQQIFLSYQNLKDQNARIASDSSWGNVYGHSRCYVLLKPGVTAAQANKGLAQLVKKNYEGRDLTVWLFKLQPLADMHFNSDFDGDVNKKYLWALAFIGLFLIITACVNFINLATAQALNRSKEVGVRKVLGSMKSQLFWQFMAETALITVVAVFIAYGISWLALPAANKLFGEDMHLSIFSNWQLPVFLLLTTVLIVFFSGSYPGLIMSRFQPILALKSKLSQKHIGGFPLRRILVVTQFAISQLLIIGTLVITSQMRYARNADLGFRKDAIVMLPIPLPDPVKMNTLRNQLAGVPGVESISLCYQAPASGSNSTRGVRFDTHTESEHWDINLKQADDQYLKTFNIKLVAGRNIYPSDTLREYLVNETFVKKLNLTPDQVVGRMLHVEDASAPIAGVVKDFNLYSFHQGIDPVCIMAGAASYSNCAVKVQPQNIANTLAALEQEWIKIYPDDLFAHTFLDERIARFYEQDLIMLRLVQAFACIAIFIGCLGLYGLVSFMAIRKTKEIGVRKVLGASTHHILWLFGKEFSRLLVVAFVIAAPFAWWVMHLYLQDFTYRIQMGAGIFILAIAVTFLVAFVTVGYRSLKAAFTNPVKSLRTE